MNTRWILCLLAATFCFSTFAQEGRLRDRLKTAVKDRVEIDFSTEPEGEPSEDLTVEELQIRRNDLKGEVVELEFTRVLSLKQAGSQGYIATIVYESSHINGLAVVVPPEGLDFFQKLVESNSRTRDEVYVQVLGANTLRALGTRYNKSKDEGERYSW